MAKTSLCKNGADLNKLTDQQRLFTLHYLSSNNGTESAIAAGYSKKCANVSACKLLKKPAIKHFIGKTMRLDSEKFEIEREDILRHLAAGATRDGKSFVDANGLLIENINDLPEDVTRSIDSIKQRKFRNQDGEMVHETEIKLMPKAVCLRMAMENRGLFQPTEVAITHGLNWDELLNRTTVIEDDVIEMEILEA